MRTVVTHKKFLTVTGQQIQAAICDKKNSPIKKEFYRLVDYFESVLNEGDEKCANALEKLMQVKKRPLIESLAIEYAATLSDNAQSTKEEAKIPPDTLRLIGETAFGPQWQTRLAKALGVADRTMRRWAIDGAPLRIGREVYSIISEEEKSVRKTREFLESFLKRPNLHLVKD